MAKKHSWRDMVKRRKVVLAGIINVTPDSFSDGGLHLRTSAALRRAEELAAAGAVWLDFGAESTRPGAPPVPAKEQLRRLLPVLRKFRRADGLIISVDTQSASVARACLDAGADVINDVSALRGDPEMASLVAERGCGAVLMHMRGTPRTMQKKPRYANVTTTVHDFFQERLRFCRQIGIARKNIILDPGIGFGKTVEHNLELLRCLSRLAPENLPLMVGVSRKSFLGRLTEEELPANRVAASVAAGIFAVEQGAKILRVHDLAEHRAALTVWSALKRTSGAANG
jgi:dihydropteroate synthase